MNDEFPPPINTESLDKGVREFHEMDLQGKLDRVTRERDALAKRVEEAEQSRDAAYTERNQLVALLASMFPSGIAKTAIEGWDDEWHGCIYIDFPWGQASWHYHDSQAEMFQHLPEYMGSWDGHTTEQKYEAIAKHAVASTARAELEGEGTA